MTCNEEALIGIAVLILGHLVWVAWVTYRLIGDPDSLDNPTLCDRKDK